MARFVRNLGVREPQGGQPCCSMPLVTEPVASLLGRGTVVAEAIGFNDEAEAGPVEVDFEAVDLVSGEGQG